MSGEQRYRQRTAIMKLVQQAWEAHPLPPPRWQDVSSDVARDGLPVAARSWCARRARAAYQLISGLIVGMVPL